jgi:hypothetical protein
MSVIPATGRQKWEDHSQSGPSKNMRSYLKIMKAKRAGNVAQLVELLSSKHRVLSSNSSTAKITTKDRLLPLFSLFPTDWLPPCPGHR